MSTKVFIDGEAGTTGLQIRHLLAQEPGIDLLTIEPSLRKEEAARRACYQEAEIVILCLPDDAAKEAVKMADVLGSAAPRLIDASSAHRVEPGWVYGFPEWQKGHSSRIAQALRVSNPGCYPTGAIALLNPLVAAKLLPVDYPVTVNAVSGYSGGGKAMIEAYEAGQAPDFQLYALSLEHKHLPEMTLYSGLKNAPIFVPSVGNFRQGMLVSVPLFLDSMAPNTRVEDVVAALHHHYGEGGEVRVVGEAETRALAGKVEPQALNGTNQLEIFVFPNAAKGQIVLVARLDNLGKGASGAAVQNLRLMIA